MVTSLNVLSSSLKKLVSYFKKISGKSPNKTNIFSELKKQNIDVHRDSYLGKNTTIGFGTSINGIVYIASSRKYSVQIGKYCAIAHGLRIRVRNHKTGYVNLQEKFQNKYQFPNLGSFKGPVIIGNNVWIGDNVIILSGVTIGDGAVLGAGAVVTKDIPPYSIAVGSPARVVKKRFNDEIIEQLLNIKWWDWSEDKIKRNRQFFSTDFNQVESLNLNNLIVD